MADNKPIKKSVTNVSSVITKVTDETTGQEVQESYPLGVSFENVLGTDEKGEKVSLKYFFQQYQNFLMNSFFLFFGKKKPVNKQIAIWIKPKTGEYSPEPIKKTVKIKNYSVVSFD